MARGLQLGDFMTAHQPNIAVVIPCLNEETTIETVVRDFRQALPEARIHVIDNGSTDCTAAVAAQAGANVIFESRRGKGNAIRRIVRSIDADVYVMVDGDSTYPADQVMTLVSPILNDEADMVVGDRISGQSYKETNTRPLHNFGNRLVCALVNRLYGTDVKDVMSGYRAFSRRSLENMPVLSEGFEVETEMTLHALDRRYRVLEVPIRYVERPEGSHSKLRTYADGMLVLRTIASVAKNHKPLYFFTWISTLIAVAGLTIGTPVLIEYARFQYIYKVPSAILASSLILLAMLSFACGLILDTVVRHHRESYELELNRLGPPT